jgi:O-antigen/teichoic acid export membrane protein
MQTANKTIAKNTIILYFRMMFTMIISLYTSRVILQVLGVDDYGLYAVVGGVVGMLAFLNKISH